MFALIGATLHRLRKEHGKTLEQIGKEAGLGRGQLSRIENAHQEATLSTLAKILQSQGVSRRDFFRRYELVEDEARKVRAGDPATPTSALAAPEQADGAAAIQSFFGNLGSFFRDLLEKSGSVAQGAVEVGDLTVVFQVVSRAQGPAPQAAAPAGPPAGPAEATEPGEDRARPRRGRPPGRPSPRRDRTRQP
jgi:transcriptional regulator with XRE-family HTH domain